jgi:hypothetical protein
LFKKSKLFGLSRHKRFDVRVHLRARCCVDYRLHWLMLLLLLVSARWHLISLLRKIIRVFLGYEIYRILLERRRLESRRSHLQLTVALNKLLFAAPFLKQADLLRHNLLFFFISLNPLLQLELYSILVLTTFLLTSCLRFGPSGLNLLLAQFPLDL